MFYTAVQMQATCQSNRFSFIVKFHGQWYSFSITDLPWNPQTWKKIVIWGYPYKQSVWGNLMFFFEPSYSFHIEYTFSSYLGSIALYLNSIKLDWNCDFWTHYIWQTYKFWISQEKCTWQHCWILGPIFCMELIFTDSVETSANWFML